MRISVSLSEKDAQFLDAYAKRTGSASKSAVVRRALDLLRGEQLEHAYAVAWEEWQGSEDARLWERTSADGLTDASG
jgi:Arc/MetJ-type ribon-helix-helix transcriptional regulator